MEEVSAVEVEALAVEAVALAEVAVGLVEGLQGVELSEAMELESRMILQTYK